MIVRTVAAALVVAGLVAGTALDDRTPAPVVRRAGFRVVEADFHAHTRFSDGLLSPFDLVVQAERRKLDAFAVTEHNMVFPARLARAYSRLTGGPAVIVGEEITTDRYHLIAIGLSSRVDASQRLGAVIDDVHRQGGLAIAAHPVRRYWSTFAAERERLDGAELMHPIALSGGREGWKWTDVRDFWVASRDAGADLAAIGSSDYHFGSVLGVCRTFVFVDEAAPDLAAAVVDAVRARRTVVIDPGGIVWGPPALVAALEREPLPAREVDYGYRGAGWLDRATRALAWLGLLALYVRYPRHRRG